MPTGMPQAVAPSTISPTSMTRSSFTPPASRATRSPRSTDRSRSAGPGASTYACRQRGTESNPARSGHGASSQDSAG